MRVPSRLHLDYLFNVPANACMFKTHDAWDLEFESQPCCIDAQSTIYLVKFHLQVGECNRHHSLCNDKIFRGNKVLSVYPTHASINENNMRINVMANTHEKGLKGNKC